MMCLMLWTTLAGFVATSNGVPQDYVGFATSPHAEVITDNASEVSIRVYIIHFLTMNVLSNNKTKKPSMDSFESNEGSSSNQDLIYSNILANVQQNIK